MGKETQLVGNGRRGRGEGSIYRRKDGRWVGQYDLRTDLGKKTKYIYGKTRKEVASTWIRPEHQAHQLQTGNLLLSASMSW
jgi:hypothetical protein